jgi:MATE family multidrug resistance protein
MSSHQREADIVSVSSSLSSTPTEATPLITRLSDEKYQPTWSGEFSWLVKNAIPIVFTFLMQNSLQLASVFTLGHLVSIYNRLK